MESKTKYPLNTRLNIDGLELMGSLEILQC